LLALRPSHHVFHLLRPVDFVAVSDRLSKLAPNHSRLDAHHRPQHPLGRVRDQEGFEDAVKGRFRESSGGFGVMSREYAMIA